MKKLTHCSPVLQKQTKQLTSTYYTHACTHTCVRVCTYIRSQICPPYISPKNWFKTQRVPRDRLWNVKTVVKPL